MEDTPTIPHVAFGLFPGGNGYHCRVLIQEEHDRKGALGKWFCY